MVCDTDKNNPRIHVFNKITGEVLQSSLLEAATVEFSNSCTLDIKIRKLIWYFFFVRGFYSCADVVFVDWNDAIRFPSVPNHLLLLARHSRLLIQIFLFLRLFRNQRIFLLIWIITWWFWDKGFVCVFFFLAGWLFVIVFIFFVYYFLLPVLTGWLFGLYCVVVFLLKTRKTRWQKQCQNLQILNKNDLLLHNRTSLYTF